MSMSPHVADKRPPFVRFEEREMGFNLEASELAGRPIPKVVTLACVTPHGSKDVFEKVADEFLAQLKRKALAGEYPTEWLHHFELQYSEFKKGNELPREGTPTKTWAGVSKEQSVRLCALGYTTIEDVAQIPDSGLPMLGLDGRYLRDLARSWINESKDKGVNARALADAQVKIESQQATIESLQTRLAKLEQSQEEAPRRGPGRPRKEEPE
jgi:hypothetical protein